MSDDLIERLRNFTEEDAYAMPWTFGAVVRDAADELARLRAEVERLTAALSDERAHADALMGDVRQRLAYDAETFHDQGAWDREDACLSIIKRLDAHRARRQG